MKFLFVFFLFVATEVHGQVFIPVSDPIGVPCFKTGDPIWMRFFYSGDKEDWDAGFTFSEEETPPLIRLSASAVFVISTGTGPFETRVTRERKTYQQWELLEAPRGQVVVPKNKDFGQRVAYMITVNMPFDQVIDLRNFFKLEEPGVYTLVWGCEPKYLVETVFEIIP